MKLQPDQTLIETWTVTYTRAPRYGKHEARLSWPHEITWLVTGRGDTVEEARLDLARKLGKAVGR